MSRGLHPDVDELRLQQAAPHRRGRLRRGHRVIVGPSFLVTVLAWQTSRSAVEARTQQRFALESERAIDPVRERLEHHEDALPSAVAAVQASGGSGLASSLGEAAASISPGRPKPIRPPCGEPPDMPSPQRTVLLVEDDDLDVEVVERSIRRSDQAAPGGADG